ncbi:MAG: amino acid adenylation domain-containing protein [Rhizonema sp. NSF051]|nr:amino acid adenylation domain-containing protein [Rhizonema sp. NSF051]
MYINQEKIVAKPELQMRLEWNDIQAEYTQDACIHFLFEAQVEKTPDAVAVVLEDRQITYRQLNSQANQLAHYLQTLGVKPEVLVGLCVERSIEMIVGMLGILKAGAAYVPLDPAYPMERLEFMLSDALVPVLLTHSKLESRLPESNAQVVCLDTEWQAIASYSQSNPVSDVNADNLIYVIYTSGSTGQPKGVMIPHRGIANQLNWRQTTFGLTALDKVLQTISFSFDPSVWQIFWPLCFGAQLVLAKPGGHQDTSYLVKTIIEEQITVIALVPSILRVLLEEKGIEDCYLKHVTCGGEALPVELVERFLARMKKENVLLNCYGPTEASIDATYWTCQRGTNYTIAPIGQPIANTQIYILDEDLQPVGIGEAGELHIGGVGLARGYLNRPELTQQKFIPNPLDSNQLARLYKTGDLARYTSDGIIEFLGRVDHQVKIRGFRIELGEIEAKLSQHSALQQTLVIAREDVPGDKRLVAYVVAQAQVTQMELRSFLRDKLPEHMVPATFVFLDAMPLSPNGKVDRRALPSPDASDLIDASSFVSPRNSTEEVLAVLWAEVLGFERLGIHNNFFELGGHSLLATQVISRTRQAFNADIPLQLLFEKPTIADFAIAIAQLPKNSGASQNQSIPQLAHRQLVPLSFAQQRMWFSQQMEPNSRAFLVPIAQRLIGKLNVGVLQQSLDAIAAHHEALRTNFIASPDGSPVQVIAEPRPVQLKIINLIHEPQKVDQVLNQEAFCSIDLTSDLMLRGSLLQINDQEHILLLVMHHIASDGWSMGILGQQLAAVYEAFLNNLPNPLPELPIQYADFAVWQRQWLEAVGANLGANLGANSRSPLLDYWKKQLAGIAVLELPTDQPRPSVQNYLGASQSLVLSKNLTAALKALSQGSDATLFMTLLAAFKTLLYHYTLQEDIIVGTPIAGRNQTETEGLIGCFINTVALRTDLSGNPSFRELVSRIRKVAMEGYAHQDMPFEKLVEELQPERNLSRHPVFDVMFNFINTPLTAWTLSGLSLSSVELSEPESKFSMTLYAEEHSGELRLQLVYQQVLFSAARMTWLLNQFEYLLEQIVATPNLPIKLYSLVTPESRTLLPDPSAVLPEPEYKLVPAMFANWVNHTPEHSAIRQGDRAWNYRELSKGAHAVAEVLLSHDIKQGETVAVFGQRSFGLIASMMGVFLSGGVLLTIDPKLPQQRQQIVLSEAKAKYLLYISDQQPEEKWQSLTVIHVNPDTGIHRDGDEEPIDLPILSPDDAAYIFFTSGTTGVPKGVLGCHKGMAHFLNWQRQTFGVNQKDRSAQLTGISFDVVLRDVFLPLTSGATLCLPAEGDELEPTRILRWLEREQISLLHTVPTLAQSWLVNVPTEVSLSALRCIFFAGEPLKDTLIRQWCETFPKAGEIVNLYGPTETTMAKCYYRVNANLLPGVQPVGSPLPETQALVLADNNQLCGIGEAGQIVIRTPFRSLGYINASIADSSRFVKNSFRNDEQDLLYYTGDRGRYRPDGTLEILGRMDRQVKIRGVRIELREIEAILGLHSGVREVVVVAREDEPGDQRLVAYVILQQACTTDELRSFLKDKLPKYSIPSAFVILDAFPLTPNGKVDRKALPIPERNRLEVEKSFTAPRDRLESQLTEIWEEVLGIQPISVKDNFFDLGGHSLLAVRLFAQIEKTFGISIPLATLFQSGNVETQAKILYQGQLRQTEKSTTSDSLVSTDTFSSIVEIQPNGSQPPLFVLHPLGGEILCYRHLAMHLESDQPIYGLQPQGLDGKPPFTRLEDMAAHYIQEIQIIQPHGPYFLVGYSFGGVIALEMAQQLHKRGEKVGLLVMIDTLRAGYSKRSPLWKRVLLHLNNILQQGPTYLTQKAVGWRKQSKYELKHRYKHYLDEMHHLEKTDKHLEIIDANTQALDKYTFPVYPGKMTLLRTEDQYRSDAIGIQYDLQFGWGDLIAGGIDLQYIPGSHLSLLEEPHVRVLAEKLQACLKKATAQANRVYLSESR